MLLHISSLPSPHGVGDLGPGAYRFVDFLAEAKQGFWQILPLGPTDPAHGNSPYLSSSAFAGNPLFISLELLKEEGLLSKADLREMHTFPAEGVDYPRVLASKAPLLDRAWQAFKGGRLPWDYKAFVESNSYWLQDYCLFKALKARFGGLPWNRWPAALRCRERDALEEAQQQLSEEVEREAFLQYLFFKQWRALKAYCESKGVQVIGDLPIYVTQDSADVWAHPEIFKLDGKGRPQVVAGVPPDYFSRTGQRWGNPLYRWEELQRRRYDWWVERMRHNLGLFDLIRVDHFRGFLAYWEIPAGDRDARRGRWVEAPAEDFFEELQRRFPVLPIIAEDLGVITPDVREVMARFGFPGMKILQFAFGEDFPRSPYLPHNFPRNCVAYTGTHDNNTVRGWFEGEASPEERGRVFRYLGREVPPEELPWELIRLLMMSVADGVIIPMQDLLGLGEEARMNRPAHKEGNWRWRIREGQMSADLRSTLRDLTEVYGRG